MNPLKATARDSLEIYNDASTVEFYAAARSLQRGEKAVFEKYVASGCSILDIGVGGGRTTPFLSSSAGRYLGVDYAQAMVDACRSKFPDKEFRAMDAVDLSSLGKDVFDIVVFSFNGLDCLPTTQSRSACLTSIHSVLRQQGLFIFSCHNARVLFVCPDYEGASMKQIIWRSLRMLRNISLIIRQLFRKAFYAGEGYIVDPVHGGHRIHVSIPNSVERELRLHGFELLQYTSSASSNNRNIATSPSFYYVARKSA